MTYMLYRLGAHIVHSNEWFLFCESALSWLDLGTIMDEHISETTSQTICLPLINTLNFYNKKIANELTFMHGSYFSFLFFFWYGLAHFAMEKMNHSMLNGKMIRVTWSLRDPDARKSGVGNVFVKVQNPFMFFIYLIYVYRLLVEGDWLFWEKSSNHRPSDS